MATTTKTLEPTNQTITLPDMTERPNNSTQVDSISKEADAINALNSNLANIGNQIIDEIANTNVGSDGVNNWIDVKYIDVSAGTYYVQYSQFGSSTESNMVIAIIANSATCALQSNAINSFNMGISVSAVVKMASSGRITLRIKTSATMSNRERHIGFYRISA